MKKGLGIPFMAACYSFFCFLCALGMGSMVQANSAAETLEFTWGIPSVLGSGILALLTGAVILGGIKRIGKAAEYLLPLASGIYILFSLLVLLFAADPRCSRHPQPSERYNRAAHQQKTRSLRLPRSNHYVPGWHFYYAQTVYQMHF